MTVAPTSSNGIGTSKHVAMARSNVQKSRSETEEEAKGKKTRSRRGCFTCRDRHVSAYDLMQEHQAVQTLTSENGWPLSRAKLTPVNDSLSQKKCDEQFHYGDDGESCSRCFHGSWLCLRPAAAGTKPLKAFSRGKTKKASEKGERPAPSRLPDADLNTNDLHGIEIEAEGLSAHNHKEPNQNLYRRGSMEEVTDAAATLSTSLAASSQSQLPVSHAVLQSSIVDAEDILISERRELPHSVSQAQVAPPVPSLLNAAHLASPSVLSYPVKVNDSTYPSPMINGEYGSELDSFFQSLDAIAGPSTALGNFWERSPATGTSGTGAPGTPVPNSALIGDVATQDRGTKQVPDSPPNPISPSFPRPNTAQTPTTPVEISTTPMVSISSMPLPATDSSSLPSADLSEADGLEPDIAPMYIAWNDGFFRSMPKPVREVVTQRMNNVAATSELTRAASMAMVLLYRSRTSNADDRDETSARLLRQSDAWFQQALQHLQTPIPLEAQLIAVLDMQAYQFDQWGAAAAHAILLLGEYFVTEAFSVQQPALDLSGLRDSSSMALRAFAYTDVLHTICIPRRRTLFAFANQPGDFSTKATPISTSASDETDRAVETHLGLPVGLLLCFSAISNLGTEVGALPDEVVSVKAAAIEKAIREWRPLPPDAAALADSVVYLDELSTAEMWRHAALLYLYQAVHHHGSLSSIIRSCLSKILQIGARVMNAPTTYNADNYVSACATRSAPWFLAGTVALLPEDRELVRKGLQSCGPQKGYKDNLQAVEKIWEVTDQRGWNRDWHDILADERLFVGFL